MRIILFLPDFLDTHSHRLTRLLLHAGQEVIVVGKQNPLPQGQQGFTFVNYPQFQLSRGWRGQRLWRYISDRGTALLLRRIWQQVQPDVVHVLWIDLRAYRCALAKLHPLILTALGSDINNVYEMATKNSKNWKMVASALKAADFLTADTREVLERSNSIAEKDLKSELVYFGIDTSLFAPRPEPDRRDLRCRLGIPDTAKVILSPRRLNPKMQHDIILRAFSKLVLEEHMDAVLVFRQFGFSSDAYTDSLKAQSISLGIDGLVFWVDEMDYHELPILYSLSDVVVNVPSRDAFPVTLFEAAACQTPVITSDLPAYAEFIAQGCYTQVPAGDVDALHRALAVVLMPDADQIKACLERNRRLVIETANQEIFLERILKIYAEMIFAKA